MRKKRCDEETPASSERTFIVEHLGIRSRRLSSGDQNKESFKPPVGLLQPSYPFCPRKFVGTAGKERQTQAQRTRRETARDPKPISASYPNTRVLPKQ